MPYPKIIFTLAPIDIEIEWLYGFLFYNKWGWGKRIIKKHPEIKAVFDIKDEKNRKKFLKNYINEFRVKNRKNINKQISVYKKAWRKIEKNYFSVLSKIIETSWPKERKDIIAMISINPICPRFLDKWSFLLFYNQSMQDMRETIMHESCHFFYFKKWKEIFPTAKERTFDYPYLEWHLSEILAPVILNDCQIQKLLKKKPVFYNEHEKIIINNTNTPAYFNKLYKNHLKEKSSFGAFLKIAYQEIKRNRTKFRI